MSYVYELTSTHIAQLKQLLKVTWDGDVIGKQQRDDLIRYGYVDRFQGWNFITSNGVAYLVGNNLLTP